MRTAGLPNFRKLFGRIDQDLLKGTYTVTVTKNAFAPALAPGGLYDVTGFKGQKSFILSTTNIMGGRNYFLAICYIVVGALCLMFSVIFFAAFMQRKSQAAAADQPRA
jgi:uncharacterized membrane protein YuzA (DUF378 family)